ncbi:MAG: hypothetical protein CFE21_06510 [Bacteroidetes bacterium B1(2017)]|nr:MAG: hypothetical protein CFE21_06510 [Bacteroidetes bacterium B1(2017)]
MRTALITGISGKIGKEMMEALVNNRHYKRIVVFTRRDNHRLKNIHIKKVLVDFSDIQKSSTEFEGIDDVFCFLGTDYISTTKLDDGANFEFDYPYEFAKVAKATGVKNFYLLNSNKANANSNSEKYKLRARLEQEIENLGFENFIVFRVNNIKLPVNLDSTLYAAKKSLSSVFRVIGLGNINKFAKTPSNLLAKKMIETALASTKEKTRFLPSDY